MTKPITIGSLVVFSQHARTITVGREGVSVPRLDNMEAIDEATNSIGHYGFSNISYTKWPNSELNGDTSKSPLSLHRLQLNSIGLVVGTLNVYEFGGLRTSHEIEGLFWRILFNKRIYLLHTCTNLVVPLE